jgi:hypothetical protein
MWTRPYLLQGRGSGRGVATWLALALVAALLATIPMSASAATGHRAHSYAGFGAEDSGGAITGQKPESKLWFHDGSWWAAMLAPARDGAHTIHKLTGSTWVDTGVVIDRRPASKEDVLLAGSSLYILSRGNPEIGESQLRRFSYRDGTYQLDAGFPATVPGHRGETGTLARDSTGRLWITYTQSRSVRVAHSTTSDTAWSQPFLLPVPDSDTLTSDDISSVVAFEDATGPAVGVMWSHQRLHAQFFAVHRDGDAPGQWSLETALSGDLEAEDHINLKTHDGQVYAVVKTSASEAAAPLIRLLVRTADGRWNAHPVARRDERHTRPITVLQLDPANRRIYVFMTRGEGPNAEGIQYKSSSMTGIGFPAESQWLIKGDAGEPINDATSTKQNATAASGIVVLASDGSHYWWNKLGGTTDPDPVSFNDIADSPHAENILKIAEAGITSGYSDGSFRPNAPVTRGQMATFLTKGLELPPGDASVFSDVAGHTHESGIGALVGAEITSGYSDGTFRPNTSVTRGQMATFLAKGLGL